jgi:superoxide reductase
MLKKSYSCEDDILCGVNVPKDENNLEDLEKKHLPVIEAPNTVKADEEFEVNIHVGGIDGVQHPNEPGHFIEWVELYSGDTFIGKQLLSGGTSYPVAKFKLKLSHARGPLKVRQKCNLHGLWEAKKDITVE